MTPRTQLAVALTAALGDGWTIHPSAKLPDAVTRPTVLLWVATIDRGPQLAPTAALTATLWVLTGKTDPTTAEDDLDASLEAVLSALTPLPWIDWSTAERDTLADTFHGWRITARMGATLTPTTGD